MCDVCSSGENEEKDLYFLNEGLLSADGCDLVKALTFIKKNKIENKFYLITDIMSNKGDIITEDRYEIFYCPVCGRRF